MKAFQGRFLALVLFVFCSWGSPCYAVVATLHTANPVEEKSPYVVATIDFLLPGYGLYTQNEKWLGGTYFVLNLVSLTSLYFSYQHWIFSNSAYSIHGDDSRIYRGRAEFYFVASILANFMIRVISSWHSYSLMRENVDKKGLRYEFYPDNANGFSGQIGYFLRF